MSFPIPQPTVTCNGPQRSAVDLANEAIARRRAEQFPPPEQLRPPRYHFYGETKTDKEADAERLARLRPRGELASGFRAALDAIEDEKLLVRARIDRIASDIEFLLKVGTAQEIQAAESDRALAEIELRRLDRVNESAQAGLAQAEAREAEERDILRAQIPAAEKTVSTFKSAIDKEFPKLGARLREILDMEARCDAALRVLREAENKLPDYTAPPAPTGPRLHSATVVPGYIERPRAPFDINEVYRRA